MTIETERLRTAEQIMEFLDGSSRVDFEPAGREETWGFVCRKLARQKYGSLGRADKGVGREYLAKAVDIAGRGLD